MHDFLIGNLYMDELPFLEMGFQKECWGDKDHQDDPYDTLYFVTWRRNLNEEMNLEVTYSFEVYLGQTRKYLSHSVELVAAGASIQLNASTLQDLEKIIDLFTQQIHT
jgi:hypothetical protein